MESGRTVLRLDKVSKSFGGLQVLVDIDLTVKKEEIVGLIGPNGAGQVDHLQRHYLVLSSDEG